MSIKKAEVPEDLKRMVDEIKVLKEEIINLKKTILKNMYGSRPDLKPFDRHEGEGIDYRYRLGCDLCFYGSTCGSQRINYDQMTRNKLKKCPCHKKVRGRQK